MRFSKCSIEAIADKTALVRVVCYDLNDPAIVSRLKKLKKNLWIIIDDSDDHKPDTSAKSQAAERLAATAGADQVKRQHMSNLQHNKTIVVDGTNVKAAVCGSTNFTWRGQFVQSNNAIVVAARRRSSRSSMLSRITGRTILSKALVRPTSTDWHSLELADINAKVTFSALKDEGVLQSIADDILSAKSSVLYSLAFLNQTGGAVTDAIKEVTKKDGIFVYGISDKRTGGLDVHLPNGKVAPVFAANLSDHLPEPFKSEPSGLTSNDGGYADAS